MATPLTRLQLIMQQMEIAAQERSKWFQSIKSDVKIQEALKDGKIYLHMKYENRLYFDEARKSGVSFIPGEICLIKNGDELFQNHRGIPDDKMAACILEIVKCYHASEGRMLDFPPSCPCGGCS
jgi:hypothetical protein